MFLCEQHHSEAECDTDHDMRSWGPCEICAATGEGAGHSSISCFSCPRGPELPEDPEPRVPSKIRGGTFCSFRSARGAWCWESKGHLGPHADGAGNPMSEASQATWSLNGRRHTAPEILREAAQSHPDDKLSDLLEQVATFLDRSEG